MKRNRRASSETPAEVVGRSLRTKNLSQDDERRGHDTGAVASAMGSRGSTMGGSMSTTTTRKWIQAEKDQYKVSVANHGKDYLLIARDIKTKNFDQCKNAFSRFRDELGLDDILKQRALNLAKASSGGDTSSAGGSSTDGIHNAHEDAHAGGSSGSDNNRADDMMGEDMPQEQMHREELVPNGVVQEPEGGEQEQGQEEMVLQGGEHQQDPEAMVLQGNDEEQETEPQPEPEPNANEKRRLAALKSLMGLSGPGSEGHVATFLDAHAYSMGTNHILTLAQYNGLVDATLSEPIARQLSMSGALGEYAAAADACSGPVSNAYALAFQRLFRNTLPHVALGIVMREECWFGHRNAFILSKTLNLSARENLKISVTLTEETPLDRLLSRKVRHITINSSQPLAILRFPDGVESIHLISNPAVVGGLKFRSLPRLPPSLLRLTAQDDSKIYPDRLGLPEGLLEMTLNAPDAVYRNASGLKTLRVFGPIVPGGGKDVDCLLKFTHLENLDITGSSITPTALPYFIPASVKHLTARMAIVRYELLDGLESLTYIGGWANWPNIVPPVLPPTLLRVRLPDFYNGPLQLPDALQFLQMGNRFNQPIVVTRNLRTLLMGFSYDQPLDGTPAPELETVVMGHSCNSPITLPPSVRSLDLGQEFDQLVDLPTGLRKLYMGRAFNQTVQLPPKLLWLTLGANYTRYASLPYGLQELIVEANASLHLPPTLQRLTCYKDVTLLDNSLPLSLKVLQVAQTSCHCFANVVIRSDIIVDYL